MRLCSFEGCDRPRRGRHCEGHAAQLKRGRPLSPIDRSRLGPFATAFWAYVAKGDGCWEWTGYRDGDGYGVRTHTLAHRFSYELNVGPIPQGMAVCHHCDNRACVRPDHLFLGTSAENTADMVRKGRQARGSRNGQAKLTEQQVSAIKVRLAAGATKRGLAREYGVSDTLIRWIATGVYWRHV